jgi:hypothetical protein
MIEQYTLCSSHHGSQTTTYYCCVCCLYVCVYLSVVVRRPLVQESRLGWKGIRVEVTGGGDGQVTHHLHASRRVSYQLGGDTRPLVLCTRGASLSVLFHSIRVCLSTTYYPSVLFFISAGLYLFVRCPTTYYPSMHIRDHLYIISAYSTRRYFCTPPPPS